MVKHVMQKKHVITRREKNQQSVHTKVVELVAEVTTQPAKSTKVPLRYPCIIYSSFEHHAPNCP
jgi:hypothetical protein